MRYSKLFSAEIYEGSTSILLGGLYLIWCDANINSDSVETLVLLLVYVYFIRVFLFEYCHSIQGIENSCGSLEKIKVKQEYLGVISNALNYFFQIPEFIWNA